MEEPQVYDILRKTKRVIIDKVEYELREADGAAAIAYQNGLAGSYKYRKTGKGKEFDMETKGIADVQPDLISNCMFRVLSDKPDDQWPNVEKRKVLSWPFRIQKDLFKWIQDNSDLSDEQSLEDLIEQRDKLNEEIEERQGREEKEGNS